MTRRADRRRLAAALRLAGSALLLAAVLAFFAEPLRLVLGPRLALPGWSGSTAARGFMLRIVSTPPAARVTVDGEDRGATPALVNVVCHDGEEVTIAVHMRGFPRWQRTVACREGGSLVVNAKLGD